MLALVRRLRSDRMLMNSAMLFGTSLAMVLVRAWFVMILAPLVGFPVSYAKALAIVVAATIVLGDFHLNFKMERAR